MKRTIQTLLALSSIIINFSSCKNDDEPSVTIVTFKSDRIFYSGENSHAWIVIWNTQGDLVDYQPYTLGETVSISGDASKIVENKFNLGLVTSLVTNNPGAAAYTNMAVQVYTDLPLGSQFNNTITPVNGSTPEQQFFTVNFDASDHTDWISVATDGGLAGTSQTEMPSPLYYDPKFSNYNISYRTGETLRHKFLTGVKAGDVYNLTDKDFTPYDKEFTVSGVPGSGTTFIFTASDAADATFGYLIDLYFPVGTNTIKSGYLSTNKKFFTTITYDRREYQKVGSLPPSTLTLPDKSKYNVISKDIATFSTNATATVNCLRGVWVKNAPNYSTQWEVFSGQLNPKIGKLPEALTTDNPTFGVAVDFEQADFYTGNYTYQMVLDNKLNGKPFGDYETTVVSIN